jgi:hypothetical protein
LFTVHLNGEGINVWPAKSAAPRYNVLLTGHGVIAQLSSLALAHSTAREFAARCPGETASVSEQLEQYSTEEV